MATAPKSTAKKAAAPAKAPAKKAPVKKTATTSTKKPVQPAAAAAKPKAAKPATHKHHPVTAEQRRYYVEVAAYYIAERHGFAPGRELENWTAAEAEIDRLLAAGALNP